MAMSWQEKVAKKTGKNLLGHALGLGENTGFIDTGSYALNLLGSGSVFGGIPNNSFTGLAGETTTGKTFFSLGIVKHFFENPEAGCYYADTEAAVQKSTAEMRGIDSMRIIQLESLCVEDFRTDMLEQMEVYEALGPDRPPAIAVLDSLGNLSTRKELEDTSTFGDSKEAQKRRETRDMTKPGLLKGTFRLLRQKMARLKVPMIITNHIYSTMDQYRPKEIAGGSGLKYAADTIWMLTKSKAREADARDGDVIGSKITVTSYKSRMARENAQVQVLLDYAKGLDRYYGLMDIAIDSGIFQTLPKGLELPDGTKVSRKEVLRNPDQIYTQDILKAIDEAAAPVFKYGQGREFIEPEDESEEVS